MYTRARESSPESLVSEFEAAPLPKSPTDLVGARPDFGNDQVKATNEATGTEKDLRNAVEREPSVDEEREGWKPSIQQTLYPTHPRLSILRHRPVKSSQIRLAGDKEPGTESIRNTMRRRGVDGVDADGDSEGRERIIPGVSKQGGYKPRSSAPAPIPGRLHATHTLVHQRKTPHPKKKGEGRRAYSPPIGIYHDDARNRAPPAPAHPPVRALPGTSPPPFLPPLPHDRNTSGPKKNEREGGRRATRTGRGDGQIAQSPLFGEAEQRWGGGEGGGRGRAGRGQGTETKEAKGGDVAAAGGPERSGRGRVVPPSMARSAPPCTNIWRQPGIASPLSSQRISIRGAPSPSPSPSPHHSLCDPPKDARPPPSPTPPPPSPSLSSSLPASATPAGDAARQMPTSLALSRSLRAGLTGCARPVIRASSGSRSLPPATARETAGVDVQDRKQDRTRFRFRAGWRVRGTRKEEWK
ncbi:hypothetical protein B0H13DRAFT_2276615 [Mycena leptocephala]|nr:hypothetical protein B0H13DRAFT_2276615 [Mycena leptocephala]